MFHATLPPTVVFSIDRLALRARLPLSESDLHEVHAEAVAIAASIEALLEPQTVEVECEVPPRRPLALTSCAKYSST